MKKILAAAVLLLSAVFLANAQTGNWSGKLDVQGTPLTIVFHLDGDEPTLDSPDQAAQGIPYPSRSKGRPSEASPSRFLP